MERPNKDKCIDIIADELIKNGIRYTDAWEKYGKSWGISTTTFDAYWKQANEKHINARTAIEEAKTELTIQKEKEALEIGLNDKNKHTIELLKEIEELQKIKVGDNRKVGDILIVATHQDVVKAKSEIRAIRKLIGDWYGFNAAIKTENVNTSHNKIPSWFDTDTDTESNSDSGKAEQ